MLCTNADVSYKTKMRQVDENNSRFPDCLLEPTLQFAIAIVKHKKSEVNIWRLADLSFHATIFMKQAPGVYDLILKYVSHQTQFIVQIVFLLHSNNSSVYNTAACCLKLPFDCMLPFKVFLGVLPRHVSTWPCALRYSSPTWQAREKVHIMDLEDK